MTAIIIKFEREQRVEVEGVEISSNRFSADFLLAPDEPDHVQYGKLRLTVSGDSTRLGDPTQSELIEWIKEGVVAMLTSEPERT